jgi:hypothetical protein
MDHDHQSQGMPQAGLFLLGKLSISSTNLDCVYIAVAAAR